MNLTFAFCLHKKIEIIPLSSYVITSIKSFLATAVWHGSNSSVWKAQIHIVVFYPRYQRPRCITDWFNLSGDLSNAIAPFVHINVPMGAAWSIKIRWAVTSISVPTVEPCRCWQLDFFLLSGVFVQRIQLHALKKCLNSKLPCIYFSSWDFPWILSVPDCRVFIGNNT